MKPKYTDLAKYPHGYRKAIETDISKTWARARERMEAEKAERAEKVRAIKKIGAGK